MRIPIIDIGAIRDTYWLFFKLVNWASTPEKILVLTKFYLPVQNYVIILKYTQKLKVNNK